MMWMWTVAGIASIGGGGGASTAASGRDASGLVASSGWASTGGVGRGQGRCRGLLMDRGRGLFGVRREGEGFGGGAQGARDGARGFGTRARRGVDRGVDRDGGGVVELAGSTVFDEPRFFAVLE